MPFDIVKMEHLKPPAQLEVIGDQDHAWQTFKQRFNLYLVAAGATGKSGKEKVALLLTIAGQSSIDVFNSFRFTRDDDKDDLNIVLEKFNEHYSPKRNELTERWIFRRRVQKAGESYEHWVTDLKLLARTCNFGDQTDKMIRDQLVFHTEHQPVLEKCITPPRDGAVLTLDRAYQIALAHESI